MLVGNREGPIEGAGTEVGLRGDSVWVMEVRQKYSIAGIDDQLCPFHTTNRETTKNEAECLLF